MKLVDVYEIPPLRSIFPGGITEINNVSDATLRYLYDLLSEREAWQNISHREMPMWVDHSHFVASRPYAEWYLILEETPLETVGAIYLTKQDEIGIALFRNQQGKGYGPQAVKLLMEMHPRLRFLANIAPGNPRSRDMFELLGFKVIQHTMERRLG